MDTLEQHRKYVKLWNELARLASISGDDREKWLDEYLKKYNLKPEQLQE